MISAGTCMTGNLVTKDCLSFGVDFFMFSGFFFICYQGPHSTEHHIWSIVLILTLFILIFSMNIFYCMFYYYTKHRFPFVSDKKMS